MPTCVASSESSSTITTTTSLSTPVTTSKWTGFRKPPPLPPRQMSLPKPPLNQLPDIEDEDEESTPKTFTSGNSEFSEFPAEASKIVASASNLSSWSSTASVATRTNTDNPTMSHYVTNFNITKLAKKATKEPKADLKEKETKTNEEVPLKVFKQTPV